MPVPKPVDKIQATTDRTTRFRQATVSTKRRIIAAIEGGEKSGKTTLALTAPQPLYVMNFDRGTEGVVDKFLGETEFGPGDIYMAHYDVPEVPIQADKDKYLEVWEQFVGDYKYALKNAASIAIDSGSEMWELHRLARFGKLTQVLPRDYGPVNAEQAQIYKDAYETDVNLLVTFQLHAEYVNDKATGKQVRRGFNQSPYLVQANIRTEHHSRRGFVANVIDCRLAAWLYGAEFAVDAEPPYDTTVEQGLTVPRMLDLIYP